MLKEILQKTTVNQYVSALEYWILKDNKSFSKNNQITMKTIDISNKRYQSMV